MKFYDKHEELRGIGYTFRGLGGGGGGGGGGQLCQYYFASLLKRIYSLRNEFAAKAFPFRVTPFQKGISGQECNQEVTKVVSLVKMAENLPTVSSPPLVTFCCYNAVSF